MVIFVVVILIVVIVIIVVVVVVVVAVVVVAASCSRNLLKTQPDFAANCFRNSLKTLPGEGLDFSKFIAKWCLGHLRGYQNEVPGAPGELPGRSRCPGGALGSAGA